MEQLNNKTILVVECVNYKNQHGGIK